MADTSHAAQAHAARGHAGHSLGPYTVAAAVFPYVAVAFLFLKAAIVRRRLRRADRPEKATTSTTSGE